MKRPTMPMKYCKVALFRAHDGVRVESRATVVSLVLYGHLPTAGEERKIKCGSDPYARINRRYMTEKKSKRQLVRHSRELEYQFREGRKLQRLHLGKRENFRNNNL